MSFKLTFEPLESRENPAGVDVADPVGIAVTSPPPANVGSTDPAPAPAPTVTTPTQADIVAQQILENTLAGYGS